MGTTNDHNAPMMQNAQDSMWDAGKMRDAWDHASAVYLARRGRDARVVSYGNLAPGEDELRLLGKLRDQRVLDFGCGGGHNAIACALAGADVIGVDISREQLAAAKALAEVHGVSIEWNQVRNLSDGFWQAASFELVLAIQVLPYVDDAAALLRQMRALLRPGGRIIVSLDHPVRNCFLDTEMDELSPYPVRNYFDREPIAWNFAEGMPMQAHHQPLGQWVAWVLGAGLYLRDLIEVPAPPEICDELWPEDSPLAPLRAIPHTVILVAEAPQG